MNVYSGTFSNRQKMETAKHPLTDEQVIKMWYNNKIQHYSTIKKEYSIDKYKDMGEP